MSLPVEISPLAEVDVETIHNELESVQTRLGQRFATRLQEVLKRIELFPEIYGIVWESVRAARLRKFRYVVYYQVSAEKIDVIAVIHGSRNPEIWQSRVES